MGIAIAIAHILDWEARWSGSWLLNSMVAKPKKWCSESRRRSRRKGMARAEGEAEEMAWREQWAKPKKQMKDYMD